MLFSEPLQLVFGASKVVQNVNIRFPSSFSRQTVKRRPLETHGPLHCGHGNGNQQKDRVDNCFGPQECWTNIGKERQIC